MTTTPPGGADATTATAAAAGDDHEEALKRAAMDALARLPPRAHRVIVQLGAACALLELIAPHAPELVAAGYAGLSASIDSLTAELQRTLALQAEKTERELAQVLARSHGAA